jgi:SNF2 family DNA or RNA helicase
MIELYHDPARRLLVYRTGEPDRVQHYLPEARKVNGSCVAVPATLRNLQILRLLDYPIIPVMEQDGYDWPIERGKKPLAHQKLMANFMVTHPRSFNLSDMGTMKTLTTLWAADYVMQQYPTGECRALIVAPLSILQRVWNDAIFANLLGRRTASIVYGSANERSKALKRPADFYIINFDGLGIGAHTRKKFELAGLSAELCNRPELRIVIVDEASAYRDSRTKRHRVARSIIGSRDYLWLLTGTPTSNGPTDAFGLAKLVNNAKGESYSSFHARTMMRVSQFKWIPRQGANEEARKLLTPAIRFDIRDVWDGPPMTTQQREVALTDEQKKEMARLKRDLQVVVRSGKAIDAVNEAAARLKFIQISLGAVYDGDHKAYPVDASPRLSELKAVIENAPGKILCFVPLTSVVNMLYRELKATVACEVVNGETPHRERAGIFERFQSAQSNLRLLIADPGTMAHGLDLYAAQTVVWYGPVDRCELYLQANKRAHRPGQQHPVTIVQLVSNKLEREIYRRLENNEHLQGLLLDMVRRNDV